MKILFYQKAALPPDRHLLKDVQEGGRKDHVVIHHAIKVALDSGKRTLAFLFLKNRYRLQELSQNPLLVVTSYYTS